MQIPPGLGRVSSDFILDILDTFQMTALQRTRP